MKCYTVIDKKGKLVSMVYADEFEAKTEDGLFTRGGPIPEPDQTMIELYIPDNYTKMPMTELIKQVQNDIDTLRRNADKAK